MREHIYSNGKSFCLDNLATNLTEKSVAFTPNLALKSKLSGFVFHNLPIFEIGRFPSNRDEMGNYSYCHPKSTIDTVFFIFTIILV